MARSHKKACFHGDGGLDLQTAIHLAGRETFPTPTLPRPHDSNNTAGKYFPGHKQKDLACVVALGGGQINPDWEESLMGYPPGWTDIDKDSVSFVDTFPQAWLDCSWEKGVPRLILRSSTTILNRLKCLGNSVVPQIPFFLWKVIKDSLSFK
jgi:hypothetical protein